MRAMLGNLDDPCLNDRVIGEKAIVIQEHEFALKYL